uniref:diguanylate cyclase domain-containing protein n=1 Tax=Guyparkeria sp. TaxID=2035736 RepID=UPI0035665258
MSGIDRSQLKRGPLAKWFTGVIILASLVVAAGSVEAREVVVGLYDNDPKVFRDASGRPSGIFVDLVERLAAEEGWELSYVDCQWSECLELTAAGEIDLMPDVAATEERREALGFHQRPALHSWSQVYRDPHLDIDSVLDLRDRRLALLEDSIQFSRVDDLLRDFGMRYEPVLVPDIRSAFVAVAEGRADAAVVNHLFGSRYFREYGLARTPVMLEPSELFFATGKGRNADLLEAVDRHLIAWRENGDSVYYDVLEHWMAERPQFHLPGWLPWVGSIFAGILLLAIAIAVWLRYQVSVRTQRLDETSGELRTAWQVIDASPVVLFRWQPEPGWPVEYVSGNVRRWGYEAEALMAGDVPFADIIHPDDLPRLEVERSSQLAAGSDVYRQEYRIHRPGDDYFWVEGLSRLIRDDAGGVRHIEGVITDITDRRESERSQREAAAVIENTLEGVIFTNAEERILRVNGAFSELTGHDESEVLGRPVTLLDAEPAGNPWGEIRRQLAREGHWQGELTSRRKSGEAFPELRTINRVDGLVGEGDRIVHMFTDLSRIKATEEQLDFLSLHDPLTDLPNRSLLLTHLRDRIGAPGRRRLGLLMIDLDRFRDVNDSYGHDVGDELLRQVASRLDDLLGGAFLARLGGDEFAVLSEDFGSE